MVLSYSTSLGQQLRGHDFERDGGEDAEDGALLVVAGGGAGAGGLLRWALGHDVDYQVAFDAGFDFRDVGVKGDLRFGTHGGNGFDGEAVGRVAQLEFEVVGELRAGHAHSETGGATDGNFYQVGAEDSQGETKLAATGEGYIQFF